MEKAALLLHAADIAEEREACSLGTDWGLDSLYFRLNQENYNSYDLPPAGCGDATIARVYRVV